MWTLLILYFFVGLVYDVIITLYYLAITDRKPALAGFWSFIITMVGTFVLYEIIPSRDFLGQLIAYSLGCAVGTFLTIKHNKLLERAYANILAVLRLQKVRKGSRLQETRKTEGRDKTNIQRVNRRWPRMEKPSRSKDVERVRESAPKIRA